MTDIEATADTDGTLLRQLLADAVGAARPWGDASPSQRAGAIRAVADALDAAVDELVPLADEESHLGTGRLTGELGRTTFQLRLFAEVLDDGGYLDATLDSPDPDWPPGPRADLRRMLTPLGPVVVFAASNFPFAFSVAGGDTASALAAGCPVLLKAHPGHLRLSLRTAEIVGAALAAAGAPQGTFAAFTGDANGRAVLGDPRITAGAFTGSLAGGRALFDIACARPAPIPFYGELGSLNPVFVTPDALAARRDAILAGYIGSVTLGAGQFCTKPGLLAVPEGSGVADDLAAALPAVSAAPLLNDRIAARHAEVREQLATRAGVQVLVPGGGPDTSPAPALLSVSAEQLLADGDRLLVECFGPTSLVVGYRDLDQLLAVADTLDGQLTATVHAEGTEPGLGELLRRLQDRVGRLVWNGWPTGVAVSWAMQHGGPYPATTAPTTTSVGTAAITRFLRPVTYQSVPDALLPPTLKDGNPLRLPRRVDGRWHPGPR